MISLGVQDSRVSTSSRDSCFLGVFRLHTRCLLFCLSHRKVLFPSVCLYTIMVTALQLQILQSPITGLISSVSTSVNVKLDDSNYLNWHFQMELMLEGHGIMGFVDGSSTCPHHFVSSDSVASEVSSGNSSANVENNEYKVWKMHDRALM